MLPLALRKRGLLGLEMAVEQGIVSQGGYIVGRCGGGRARIGRVGFVKSILGVFVGMCMRGMRGVRSEAD